MSNKMKKLLIENESGIKEIIEVDEKTGGYAFPEKIIWDESKQGEIPSDKITEARDAEEFKNLDIEKRIHAVNKSHEDLKEIDLKSDLKAADIQKAIKALIKIAKKSA